MGKKPFLTRRTFIKGSSLGICALAAPAVCRLLHAGTTASGVHPAELPAREVLFYTALKNKTIQCGICPKGCTVGDGERGYCGNKENRGGKYYCLVFGQPCEVRVDPVEKKPLFHYLPASRLYSLGAAGCNFACRYCQNWMLSQSRPEQIETIVLPPAAVVQKCREADSPAIAFTYTEPVVFLDYVYECAREGKNKGLGSVMVSNGFINPEPLKKVCEHLSAVKIDLKSFSDDFYRNYCDGALEPVLTTLLTLQQLNMWFEIVVLVIPGLNDGQDEIRKMCAWIHANLGPDVPVHFTRFYPAYKMQDIAPTSVATLEACCRTAASQGLNFVYIGNVKNHPLLNTCCPNCRNILVHRIGFSVVDNHIADGACPRCATPIPGIWKAAA